MPVSKTVVLDSVMAIDPLLEKVEGGMCGVEQTRVHLRQRLQCLGSRKHPRRPNPQGPAVQLERIGANYPKIFVVPLP